MLNDFDLDKESPFQPGKPVSPDYFKGRTKIIKKILRYLNKAEKCDVQHYFITGKKGMGKTSLAKYVQDFVKDRMIGVYISNKGNHSLENLVKQILEELINSAPKDSVKSKIKNIFGNYVESIEIKGTKLNFKLDEYASKDIVDNFLYYLNKTYEELETKKGIFLIIDDINGLSESNEFVNWYKRFADSIEMRDYHIPLYVLLAGYPEKFNILVNQDESFARIFHYDNIDYLNSNEINEFFQDTFNSVGITCDEESLKYMVSFSEGIPLMMQEIGDSVYWEVEGNIVNKEYAIKGIIEAGRLIGKRQIKPVMDKSIRSENYESILMKLAENSVDSFKRSDFEKFLSTSEKKVFAKFLQRATELNILESVGRDKSGRYKFSNRLYLVYFMILNLEKNEV
jgi:hypothetical protein